MQNPAPTRIGRSQTMLKPIRTDQLQLPRSNSSTPNKSIANPTTTNTTTTTNAFSYFSESDTPKSPTKTTAFLLEPPESFTTIPPRKSISAQGRRPSAQHRSLSFRTTGDSSNNTDALSRSNLAATGTASSLPHQPSNKSLITMSSHDDQAIIGDDFLTRALASVGNNGPLVRIGSFSAAALAATPPFKTNAVVVGGGGGGASHAAGAGNGSSTETQATQVSGNTGGTGSLAVPVLSNGGEGFTASKTRRKSLVKQGSFKSPGNRRRESEFRMTIPIFNFPKEKKKRTLLIEGIPHDIDRLIKNSLKNKGSKSVPGLMALLKSDLFEHFLKCAVTYSRLYLREKLALTHDRVVKTSGIDVPSSLIHFIGELNKTEYQSVHMETLYGLHTSITAAFHEFAKSYFAILLPHRLAAKTQSKERALFESLYILTQEIVCAILSTYNLSYMLIHELSRCFRSDYFKPPMADLLRDPQFAISFRFMNSLSSPFQKGHGRGDFKSAMKSTLSITSSTPSAPPPPTLASNLSKSHRQKSFKIGSAGSAASSCTSSSTTSASSHIWALRKSLMTSVPASSSDKLPINTRGATGIGNTTKSILDRPKISLSTVRSLRSPLAEIYLPLK